MSRKRRAWIVSFGVDMVARRSPDSARHTRAVRNWLDCSRPSSSCAMPPCNGRLAIASRTAVVDRAFVRLRRIDLPFDHAVRQIFPGSHARAVDTPAQRQPRGKQNMGDLRALPQASHPVHHMDTFAPLRTTRARRGVADCEAERVFLRDDVDEPASPSS